MTAVIKLLRIPRARHAILFATSQVVSCVRRPSILTLTLVFVLLTGACDPGASFTLVDGNGTEASWPTGEGPVLGTVHASAFTIDLWVDAVLALPAGVTLAIDSASLVIRDAEGIPLQLDHFSGQCDASTPRAQIQSRRCVSGAVNLHSSNYDRLDSITVQFGYAIAEGHRRPLVARFARRR